LGTRSRHLLRPILQPVAFALEDDDLEVMDQAVDHGCDGNRVAEDLGIAQQHDVAKGYVAATARRAQTPRSTS